MTLTIEIEPQVQTRPRARVIRTKSGKIHATIYEETKTRKYKEKLREGLKCLCEDSAPATVPVVVDVLFYLPIPESWNKKTKVQAEKGGILPTNKSRGDIDNYLKAFLDAANGVLWEDDSLISSINAAKKFSSLPRIRICMREDGRPGA